MFKKLSLLLLFNIILSANTITIYVNSHLNDKVSYDRWNPTIELLNEKIPNYKFKLLPIKPTEVEKIRLHLEKKEIDFLITQPAIYIELEHSHDIVRFLTMQNKYKMTTFGSVFITKDKDINSIQDIRGKKIDAVAPLGFGGWLIAYKELYDNKIDPIKEKNVNFTGSQKRVVENVLSSKAEVGVIRTGMYEKLLKEGLFKEGDLKVINAKKTPYPLHISTKLYPEWAFAYANHVDKELVNNVFKVMTAVSSSSNVAQKGGFYGWTIPENYNEVEKLFRTFNLAHYKDMKGYSLLDIIKITSPLIILFLLIIFILKYKIQRDLNKKLEKEVQSRTEKLNDFIDASTDFIWEVDANGIYTFVSDNVLEILGYKPDEMIGKTPFDFILKDDVERISKEFDYLLENELKIKDLENWVVHKNGSKVLLLTNGVPFFKNEKLIGYRGTDKNITKVYQSESNYKTLLDNASDGIHILDLDGNIVQSSNSFANNLGYSISEVSNLNVKDFDALLPKDSLLNFLEELITSPQLFETKHKRKDGSIFDVQINAKTIDLYGKKHIYASQRDISEMKKVEEQIKESKEHYKSLVEQAPYAIEVYDITGLQIQANKEHEKLWGFSRSNTLNKLNILTDKKFKETGLLKFVNKAYNGELVEIPPYEFNPAASTDVTNGEGLTRYIKTQIYPIKDLNNNVKNIVVTHIDVSAEHEVQKRELMLNSVFQVIPDLLFIMKSDGTIIEYKAQMKNNLYMKPDMFTGKRMQDVLPEKVSELFSINIESLSEYDNLKVFQYELEIENELKYFEARMARLPIDNHIMTIIRDVTSKVLNEQRLSFQSALLEQSLAATDVVAEDELFTYVNDAYVNMWGYNNKEEIIGTSPLSHCVDPKMPETIINKVKKDKEGFFKFKARKKDGSTFDAFMAVKHMQFMNKNFFVGSTMDISKLTEQEQFIEAITQTSPALIYVYDFEKRNVVFYNGKNKHMLGYSNEEILNMEDQLLNNLIHPEDMQRVEEHNGKILKANIDDIFEIEYRIKSKDEKWLTYHSYERPFLYNEDGSVKQKVGIALDLTDLRDKEQILLYQSRLAATGEMIDNIAHQWRQPLSAISTAATGAKIQKEMDCLTEKELFSALDAINDSAQFLSQTIEDFRDFFNPNKEKNEFSLEKSINRLFALIRSKLKNRQIEIVKDIQDISIIGIENEIIQVLMNVVSNSIDALEECTYKKKYIFIKTYEEDNIVYVSIKDNAGGVPENIKHKIFESRFTTKNKGTGIGLYMSSNIINELNGKIVFENEEYSFENIDYKGANFTVNIPKS